ncbi:VanW family protein, partial [Candidatus Collierbacteria bacterium]|nr:VanW family protein [Candidatus Collierbacteria bacterium]
KMIVAALIIPGNHNVEIPTKVESAAIDSSRINEALAIANRWKGKTLRVFRNDYSYSLQTEAVFKLIGLTGEVINAEEIERILGEIKPNVEVEARNAIFNIDENKVVEFSPEIAGVKVDEVKFREKLKMVMTGSETSELEIPVIVTEPKIRAGDINNLGIKTLIGVGTSKFHNSIPNRIHNLTLASARLNGAIVAPGETFSLGNQIGDVSRATGYREAYVISQGRTVLGDGGGVCQVSTTMFRAALNAGLPIVERKAHSYRVHYYEEDLGPGFDATVFLPSADLKFVNDTPGHILVQTKVDPKTFSMRYEIYGTNDGRVAMLSKAKTYSQSAPLPTVYQDDPTLPLGTKKQVDWSAWGAKVSFDYKVTRGGEILQDRTFFSTYQPWAAVYLVGTGK